MNKERKLNRLEMNQIRYLKDRKMSLLDDFVGACNEINRQIQAVKSGDWRKEIAKTEDKR